MEPKIKTVGVQYVVRVNGEVVKAESSLKLARSHVKSLPVTEATKEVSIVKLTTTEQRLDVFVPQQTIVLRAAQLDEGMEDAEE